MRNVTSHFVRALFYLIALLSQIEAARAKPFSLVVPSDATVGVGGGHNIVPAGYFISTSETLTLPDFDASVRIASQTGGVGFSASIEPVNVGLVSPLNPGQIGGLDFSPVLDSLLLPGEQFKNAVANFYQLRIIYPELTTITQTMSASFTLGDYTASYTTVLHYNPSSPDGYHVNAAQRIIAVQIPEPLPTCSLSLSLSGWILARSRSRSVQKP